MKGERVGERNRELEGWGEGEGRDGRRGYKEKKTLHTFPPTTVSPNDGITDGQGARKGIQSERRIYPRLRP